MIGGQYGEDEILSKIFKGVDDGFVVNAEWKEHPIDCQAVADLAGARYDAEEIGDGPIVYCKTHFAEANFEKLATLGRCVLLTSGSDSATNDKTANRLPSNVVRWFTANNESHNNRVETLPIGFVFNVERTQAIIAQSEKRRGKFGLMYVNFSCHNDERRRLYEMFGECPWATVRGGDSHDDVSQEQFYADIAMHHYVLSPPGAGPDCHRTWEAMALGSIPIVIRGPSVGIFEDMPCMLVHNWERVTQNRLESRIVSLGSRFEEESVMRKLSMKYWIERIKACL